jgi:predicted KAP-like P-loop ATPase
LAKDREEGWRLRVHRRDGYTDFRSVKAIVDAAKDFIAKPQEHVSLEDIKTVAGQIGDYIKEPSKEADHLPEQIHEFRKEFVELLDAADIDQLVVIVDDLDRCLPETAIATLEAIRLFLFVPRTAFVVGADELMIEYAVREHFPDLPPSSGPVPYARNYLEKLIQVPFRIPALGTTETRTYVTLLLAESALGPKDERFSNLLAAARADLQRPWKSTGVDRAAAEKILGKLPPELDSALVISSQISRILSEGTRGNPRQIKRFLNSMMLRYAIAEERGFAKDIERPVLAKLMLAERFSPEVYEQVARLAVASPDGISTALAEFEDHVRGGEGSQAKPPKKAAKKSAELEPDALSAQAQELLKSDWAKSWAVVDPKLGGIDLRPYVFVTRDKRGYLGGLAAASHLEGLVERLLGPRMVARSAAQEVAKLVGQDPEHVFDALTARIVQQDKYDSEPEGVQGLIVLVDQHPLLQRRLLSFAKGLPVAKLGAWPATSWGGCFSDPPVAAEFKALMTEWSQTGNAVLRASASAALKLAGKS